MRTMKFTFSAVLILVSHLTFAQSGDWAKAGNALNGTEKLGSTNSQPVRFFSKNLQRMTLDTSGRFGIGTTTPKARLHVSGGKSGATLFVNNNSPLIIENGGGANNVISMINPSEALSGIIFGNEKSIEQGGILYNSFSAKNGLDFETNGSTRMVLNQLGRLGIGTTTPMARLHVFNGSSGALSPNPFSTIVTESSGENMISLLAPPASRSGLLFANVNSSADGGIVFNDPNTARGLQFRTGGNLVNMTLTSTGLLGVGTVAPKAQFHLMRNVSGASPLPGASMVVESDIPNFINLLTPSSVNSGILFGNGFDASDGGIIYNSGETVRGLQFNTGGNRTRMVVASNGFVGIGTKAPETELNIIHANTSGATNGLRLQNGSFSQNWTLFTFPGGELGLYANKIFKGDFDNSSGDYFSTSDVRRKKDIENAPDVMEKVLQLDVKKYHFLENKSNDKKHYGMLAQDVEKLFPEIVKHVTDNGEDRYMVNQSAYGVIAIKAIQEQQKKIEEQEQTNKALQQKVTMLEARLARLEAAAGAHANNATFNNGFSKEPDAAVLEQNEPNPFSSSTTIRHHLPQGSTGQINIYNLNGVLVKSVKTGSASQTLINGANLLPGTYTYTLLADGKLVGSKKMIVLK